MGRAVGTCRSHTIMSESTYDVFLSHSAKDKAVVRGLAERLRADDLRVWFDEWEIKPGDSIPAKIEEGLEHSRALVLCMSAHAFGSDWAQLEAGTFRFCDPLNKDHRLIPLRLDDAPIKGSLAQFSYVDWRDEDDQEYRRLLLGCGRSVPEAVGEIVFSQQPIEEGRAPFEYGSDLHCLWGWGHRLRVMLDSDLQPSEYTWMIFRPDRRARDAMMRFSIQYPHIIKQIDDFLTFAEQRFSEFLQNDNEASRISFADAMDALCARIEEAAPIIAANLRAP